MINVSEASAFLKQYPINIGTKSIQIEKSCGMYLAQDISAAREQPPFNRVAMDGIALKFSTISKNSKNISLHGIQRAGSKALILEVHNGAIEVMTGAPLPVNCDTVIPYEEVEINENYVSLNRPDSIKEKQNIHFQGSDYKERELLIKAGTKINSSAVAVLASQGMSEVQVKTLGKIAIISTGDELVEPGVSPEPWQIWRSNPYALKSELEGLAGLESSHIELFHLCDNEKELFDSLEKILKEYKIVILSGGVSKGKFDFIPSVLADLGVKKVFHKIKQRPGKPMFFGVGKDGQNVFGLPGNPVSALICMRRYVIESMLNSLGAKSSVQYRELKEDLSFKKEMTLFKAVDLISENNSIEKALPIKGNGSGDFFSLAASSGFLELPENQTEFKAGSSFPYFSWSKN